jgi:hypothetical protein
MFESGPSLLALNACVNCTRLWTISQKWKSGGARKKGRSKQRPYELSPK